MKKKLLIVSTIVICTLVVIGCINFFEIFEAEHPTEQGVFGVVRTPPPKEGGVLDNITVQIREFFGKDKKAGEVIASTKTDKQGSYQFDLPEGTYFLVVVGADVDHAVTTTGYKGKNFLKEEMVNTYEVVNVSSGELIEQDLVVPQLHPE